MDKNELYRRAEILRRDLNAGLKEIHEQQTSLLNEALFKLVNELRETAPEEMVFFNLCARLDRIYSVLNAEMTHVPVPLEGLIRRHLAETQNGVAALLRASTALTEQFDRSMQALNAEAAKS
jgi:hypothetical protein